MSYTAMGQPTVSAVSRPGIATEETEFNRRVMGVCFRGTKAGVVGNIGTDSFAQCIEVTRDRLTGGMSPDEAFARLLAKNEASVGPSAGPNWLLWGGVGAAVLVVVAAVARR